MNLAKKKILAAKTLGVGKARIVFNNSRLDEIKDAITKQDMRDLFASKAISIKEIKGTRRKPKRKTRRRAGSIKMPVKNSKRHYITITRKLRAYVKELKKQGLLNPEQFALLRKEIRARVFRSKVALKERIQELKWKQ